MCIIMPPAPPAATPVPAPPNPPAPAPIPPTNPGNPPGPTPPSVLIDLELSTVIDANGVTKTFNQVLYDGGFLSTVGSGSTGIVRVRTVLQNATAQQQTVTLQITPGYAEMTTYPGNSQTVAIPASNYVTVETMLIVSNGGGGTYNVTISIGTNSIVLPIGLSFLNP